MKPVSRTEISFHSCSFHLFNSIILQKKSLRALTKVLSTGTLIKSTKCLGIRVSNPADREILRLLNLPHV